MTKGWARIKRFSLLQLFYLTKNFFIFHQKNLLNVHPNESKKEANCDDACRASFFCDPKCAIKNLWGVVEVEWKEARETLEETEFWSIEFWDRASRITFQFVIKFLIIKKVRYVVLMWRKNIFCHVLIDLASNAVSSIHQKSIYISKY